MFKLLCTFLKKICKDKDKVPLWAYGVECDICNRSFINEREHYNHVVKTEGLYFEHINKIPKLRR